MSSTSVTMPDEFAFEFGLLNAVASLARAVAAIRTEEGLAVSGRGKPKSASNDSFGQEIHVIEDIQKNPLLFLFSGGNFLKSPHARKGGRAIFSLVSGQERRADAQARRRRPLQYLQYLQLFGGRRFLAS